MPQPARLMTPNGKTIELSTEAYREVRQLLASRERRRSRRMPDVVYTFTVPSVELPEVITGVA